MKQEKLAYIALAALGGAMGLAISISQPVTGFFIVGGTIVLAILGLVVNLKKTVSNKLPSFADRTSMQNDTTVTIGLLTLVSFIPLLFPEILLAAGMLMILLALLILYIVTESEQPTEFSVTEASLIGLAGLTLVVASQLSFLLVFPPAGMYLWFIYTLLPVETQQRIANSGLTL